MRDGSYLIKVLGLSGVPKLVTFALSLTTLPIVLRSVGAAQYGILLYVGAALSICEVLIDFGVSAAVGRCMAELRSSRPQALRPEIFAWARLQAIFLAGGFVPMLLIAHFVLSAGRTESTAGLLAVLSGTLGLNVVLNFCRPCLQSLLAFKAISLLDTSQSVLRSLAQLAAATFMPNALGLATAGLATSAVVAALAVFVLVDRISKHASPSEDSASAMSMPDRIRASAAFLWLRLSIRMHSEIPLLLIGRFVGPELVGIIGAFIRVREILSTPYLIVGNALMVRVHEIRERGLQAMFSLWDSALRIVSTAVFLAAFFNLAAELLGTALLPRVADAPKVFCILAPLIFVASLSSILVPISDYLGPLTRRSAVLSVMLMFQVPVLMLSISLWGASGAVSAYVVNELTLAVVYFFLVQRIFFGTCEWLVRREVVTFVLCCALALALTRVLGFLSMGAWLHPYTSWPASWFSIEPLVVFSVLFVIALRARSTSWHYYIRPDFLDFTV